MDDLTDKIGHTLAEKLEGFKYRKSDGALFRGLSGGWQAIFIEALRGRVQGTVKLSAHAHVRLDALEEIYCPYNPLLSAKDAKKHPTLVVNCDELLADKALANAFQPDGATLQAFLERYAQELKTFVVPWLDRYSKEEEVFLGLVDDDPMKWVTSDRTTRYPVLLAILARRGDEQAFERVAEEFLAYCRKPHGAVYKPLATATIDGLRKHLEWGTQRPAIRTRFES